MKNPHLKKVMLIVCIALFSLYICLPKEISIPYLDKTLHRKDISVRLGSFQYQKAFDLQLGLDLAGGSHLVFEAQTSDLSAEDRLTALESLKEVIEKRVNLFGVSEPNVQLSTFDSKDRIIVELPGIDDTQKATEIIGQTAQLVFAETGTEEEPGIIFTDLTGADLKKAQVVFDPTTGNPAVGIEFTDEGAQKFAEITKRNVGKALPILLDGIPVSAPLVEAEITGGQAQISGTFSLEEAKNLTIQLNAGALPLGIDLVEQRVIGASLGAESVQKSVVAGFIGLGMVSLFMILTYGKLGLIANCALFVFGVLTLALYKLIPVVLTLPGIAGFLLSVGMAVDSNILIFERFKEEKKKRKFEDALEIAFGRAWDSIRDANVATLVTAFVLANPFEWPFLHTSGPVRGFAITLALGIAISMFTGIYVSRNLLRTFIKAGGKK